MHYYATSLCLGPRAFLHHGFYRLLYMNQYHDNTASKIIEPVELGDSEKTAFNYNHLNLLFYL